jgi:hypothetical protein
MAERQSKALGRKQASARHTENTASAKARGAFGKEAE